MLPTIYALNAIAVIFLGKFTQQNVQPKLLILLGAVCGLSTFMISIQMKSYWAFFVFYCFSFGITTGFCYLITFHHTWLWFPDHKGLSSGICMGGYGLGALIFDNIMTPIVNPGNEKFEKECFPGADYGCYEKGVNENF
jgi:MFS transporter, OFA family, oxalate/formate antiporter